MLSNHEYEKVLGLKEGALATISAESLASEVSKRFPAISKLLDLEEQMVPIISALNQTEVVLDCNKWERCIADRLARYESNLQLFGFNANSKWLVQLEREVGVSYQKLKDPNANFVDEKVKSAVRLVKDHEFLSRFWFSLVGEMSSGSHYCSLVGTYTSYSSYSGRMSSKHMSLMSLPKEMYSCLVPQEGMKILSFDLNEAEVRTAAFLLDCRTLQDWFDNGDDPYQKVGSQLCSKYNCDCQVARKLGKVLLIPLLYGATDYTLFKNFRKVTGKFFSGQSLRQEIFGLIHGLSKVTDFTKKDQTIQTLFGPKPMLVKMTDAQKMNYPIQSAAATIFKMFLVEVNKLAEIHLLIPRHDEIIFETTIDLTCSQIDTMLKKSFETAISKLKIDYNLTDFSKLKEENEND